jgi:hypothetical protein
MMPASETDRVLEVPSDPRALAQRFYELGYTEGLPIIPPTDELVEEMVRASGYAGDTALGRMAPMLRTATIESLAVNAVMAGCRPEVFPVLVAVVRAILSPPFNLLSVQTTTHMCTPFVLVNGPIRTQIGLATGKNAFGQEVQASATLGRALRLVLRNVGGAIPGETDLAQVGSPTRLGFVAAENEEASPFPPFHTTRGFRAEDSVVTVFATEGPHNVNDHSSNTAASVLQMCVGTMATFGTNDLGRNGTPVLVHGPELAAILHREGYTREKVQAYIWEHARVPLDRLPKEQREWFLMRKDLNQTGWVEKGVPIADAPENVAVVVAGGEGRHCCYIPSFAFGRPVSMKIEGLR